MRPNIALKIKSFYNVVLLILSHDYISLVFIAKYYILVRINTSKSMCTKENVICKNNINLKILCKRNLKIPQSIS